MAASAHMALTRPMELRSAGLRAASSKELALTSTTHGLTSGKELVSSSEESRKSEFALWQLAMEDFATNLRGFAEKIVCYASTFRKTLYKSAKHFEDKDRRAFAVEFVADMKQPVYRRAAGLSANNSKNRLHQRLLRRWCRCRSQVRGCPVRAPSRHPNAHW